LHSVEEISTAAEPTIDDYVRAVSEYVKLKPHLTRPQASSARNALDEAIGRAVATRLTARLPLVTPHRGQIPVAGGIRQMGVDLVHAHPFDGLQVAIDITAINHTGNGNTWKRLKDTNNFALTVHSKFPFAVVGRILTMPTWYWELKPTDASTQRPSGLGKGLHALIPETIPEPRQAPEDQALWRTPSGAVFRRRRAVQDAIRLIKEIDVTRARDIDTDPPHLVEATAVLVYDPDTAELCEHLPARGLGLRFDDFLETLVAAYRVRFDNG
jgi:hypothetical protein